MTNKLFSFIAALFLIASTSAKAQTAMDFNTTDCAGNPVHLFADLDAGKAVVLFYFMPSCGSCPPPAQKIQTMANNINAAHPGLVKAYAFPYNNSTTCTYSQSWVTSNSLPLYAPMDSGATAVASYGGFGMPTVVLVGRSSHKVMFSTLSFSTSDTTIMRDSILALLPTTSLADVHSSITGLSVFPNPASGTVNLSFDLKEVSDLQVDIADMTGRSCGVVYRAVGASGGVSKEISTDKLPNGVYLIRITTNGKTENVKLNVIH